MTNEVVQNVIQRATQQAYDDWAVEHPGLAAVIDRIALETRAVESLRESDQYRQAVAEYHNSRNELDLFNQLLALAGPIIGSLLNI